MKAMIIGRCSLIGVVSFVLLFSFSKDAWGNQFVESDWVTRVNLDSDPISEDEQMNIVASLYVWTQSGLVKGSDLLNFYRDNITKFVSISFSDASESPLSVNSIDNLLFARFMNELSFKVLSDMRAPENTKSLMDKKIAEFNFSGKSLSDFADAISKETNPHLFIYVAESDRYINVGSMSFRDRSPREVLIMVARSFHLEMVVLPNNKIVITGFQIPHKYAKIIKWHSDPKMDGIFRIFQGEK